MPHDTVIRPAKLWNDTESAPEADALVERLGAESWADACGSVPVAVVHDHEAGVARGP